MTVRHAVITSFLSQTQDRFHVYNEPRPLRERLAQAAAVDGMTGVECVFPYEVAPADEMKTLLQEHGLEIAAVNVNVKAEPEFRDGGLTSRDQKVRSKAVGFIKEAKDYAAEVGANKVTCCPLSDGYEFAFGIDYRRAWDALTESFRTAASHRPEIPLFIEYKPSETRGACFVESAAKALCLLNDTGTDGLGVTLDFGHSLYGGENPTEALCLLEKSGYPYYIHINDNDSKWDWDYMVGTKHFLEYVEFLFYLQEFGYSDFLTSDTSPTRWGIAETFSANVRLTNNIWRRLESLDREELRGLIDGGEFLNTWRFIEREILRLSADDAPAG